jgi:signal transduction histidine kinase
LTAINAAAAAPRKDRGSMEEKEMRYRVTLVLARSREFPFGNPRCFYELLLPLKEEFRFDLEAWNRCRYGNSVRRFCRDIGEAWGELKHDRAGWFLAFGHGEASEEAFFAEAGASFALGEAIPIVEWDGQMRIFRVVDIAPERAGAGRMSNAPSSALGSDPLSAALHELSEPVTALAGFTAAARRLLECDAGLECDDGRCGRQLAEILDKIPDEARRAGEIVRRLRRLLPADGSNPPDRNAPTAQLPGRFP